MKKIVMGMLLIPSLCFASIPESNNIPKINVQTLKKTISPEALQEIYSYPKSGNNNDISKVPSSLTFDFKDWSQLIKKPKHTTLNEELKKEYQANFQTLKKCYMKPEDNLQDIMIVLGKFINAYADIVYGKEIISYKQEVQDYDRILSNTPINKGINPEECLKAREFFENQLM